MGRKGMTVAQRTFFGRLYNMGCMVAAVSFMRKINGFFAGACLFKGGNCCMVVVKQDSRAETDQVDQCQQKRLQWYVLPLLQIV